jgi:SAM-dependent methyltransferase
MARMVEPSSHASHNPEGRRRKARKVHRLIERHLPAGRTRLLDVGTGSGVLASHFAGIGERFEVSAVDVADQRSEFGDYAFQCYDGQRLPFPDGSFDVVLSNHVLEHVGERTAQLAHLREILRVLAPRGIAHIATPSRWQFVEPHFRLPALSWLPRPWRDAYVRVAGRGTAYDCNPFGVREFEAALRDCGAGFACVVPAATRLYAAEGGRRRVLAAVAGSVPERWILRLRHLSPTMVYRVGHP